MSDSIADAFADIAAGCTVRAVWAAQAATAAGSDTYMPDEIGTAVYEILKAAAALSAAQARLAATPDLAPAERDHAAGRVVDAFRRFETAAKAAPKPLAVTIRLDT